MKNHNDTFYMKIGFSLLAIVICILYCNFAFGWEVTPTYLTVRPEQYGQLSSEQAGFLDMKYDAGGVSWTGLNKKFKSVLSVVFEPVLKNSAVYTARYDRANGKVVVFSVATGSEIAAQSEITRCYFIAKGIR